MAGFRVTSRGLAEARAGVVGDLKPFPAGVRYAINLTDPKYGAVADGVTDNGAAILAAIADAQSLRLPVYAPGATNAYAFSGNITFPDGVDLIGDGISKTAPATRFLCLTSTSRLAFGYSGVGSGIAFGANPKASGSTGARGGICGNFIVDGNNIATQPLFLGRAEVLHLPLAVFNGAAQPAYNAGTAYTAGQRVLYQGFTFQALQATTGNAPTVTAWVTGAGAFPSASAFWQPVADSAGVVMQYGQNSGYLLLDIEDCAGSAIVLDGGTGGHQIALLEMNNCGSAGAYVMLITQSYATPTVYAQPSKLTIQQPVFDRTPAGALGLLNMTAGADIALHDPEFAASGVSAALYPAVAMVSDGTHTCARLKLRDASIGLDVTGSVAFAVGNGCSLDHERTVISGGAVAFAYLIQNGALIEEERPVWPTSQALLHGSSTGTLDGACAARHYAPIQGWSPASGSFQWQITELGTMRMGNVQLASGNLGSGSGGILSWGPTTTPPSANPTSSCSTWGKNGTIRARTSNGSIRTVAGNVQVQGASYTTVEGDKVVIVTVPASTAVVVTLLLAATAGSGEEVLIRRADNSTGTLTVAPGGSDTISAPGAAQSATPVSVAAFQVARFVADGTSKWLGV